MKGKEPGTVISVLTSKRAEPGAFCSAGALQFAFLARHPSPVTRHSKLPAVSNLTSFAILIALLPLPVFGGAACAFEAERVESAYEDKQFRCEVVAMLEAPASAVEAVLRDYEGYPELDARILQARVLDRPTPTTALLETKLRACFGPFCRTVRRVEEVVEAPLALSATTDPTKSDVRFGETQTIIEPVDESRTRITYRTNIVPGFWVPALGGRRWMLRTMEQATVELFENVEERAQARGGV